MKNLDLVRAAYLRKLAKDDPKAIDTASALATLGAGAAGGVGGAYGGAKLGELAYKKGWDNVVRKALQNLQARVQYGIDASRGAVGDVITRAGEAVSGKGAERVGDALKRGGKATAGRSLLQKIFGDRNILRGKEALNSVEETVRQGGRKAGQALGIKGDIGKWKKGGAIGGGTLGALLAGGAAYGLTNPKSRAALSKLIG